MNKFEIFRHRHNVIHDNNYYRRDTCVLEAIYISSSSIERCDGSMWNIVITLNVVKVIGHKSETCVETRILLGHPQEYIKAINVKNIRNISSFIIHSSVLWNVT
jgi:hypothetical protein